MRNKVAIAALAAVISASTITAAPAAADSQYYSRDGSGYYADNSGYYDRDGGRYYNGQPVYSCRNEHYYRHHHCGGNGAVGTVGGGAGGALIGNALGGTTGLILGGVGGALLGRHLDKENTRDRRGC